MLQLVQSLRDGQVQVIEVPEPAVRAKYAKVAVHHSVISPGTEGAVARTAGKGYIGKALDRPDQVRQVVRKVAEEGIAGTAAAVRARLDDFVTPGYSLSGEIVELSDESITGLRVGDRVACVGANTAVHAEVVVVPEAMCFRLGPGADLVHASFAALGAIAGHGTRLAGVDAGGVVGVIGMGLLGQIAAQLVTLAGADAIVFDPRADRVALGVELGASDGAVLAADDPHEVASRASRLGLDAVIVTAAAKNSGPARLAAELAGDRARVILVGDVGLDFERRPLFEKELELRVSRSYGPGRYDPAYEIEGREYPAGYIRWTQRRLIEYFLREVERQRVVIDKLISHRFDIGEGERAYEVLDTPDRMGIVLSYPAAGADGPVPRAPSATRITLSQRPSTGKGLRIGLVGPGTFARSRLIPAFQAAGVEICAVAGLSGARAVGVARRTGARYVGDVGDLIDDPSLDALVIATRHDSHSDLVVRSLEAGKAVFVEKPLAISFEQASAVEHALSPASRLVCGFNRDWAPTVRAAREALMGRREPIQVICRVNAGFLPDDHWLRDPAAGGGRLVGEGCHFVALINAIVDRRLVGVQARALPAVGGRTLAHDSFQLFLEFEDGSLGTVHYVSSGGRGLRKERIEILGAGLALEIDDFLQVPLTETLPPWSRRVLPRRRDKGHQALVDEAVRFFMEDGPPPISYGRLLDVTRATLEARDQLTARAA